MARWLTYLRERSPLPLLLPIALGVFFSARYGTGKEPTALAAVGTFVGLVGWLVLARLMDEKKDYAKDVVAHPERPLPRGLLTVAEVEVASVRATFALFGVAAVFAAAGNVNAAVAYAAAVGFLWLMYKEFYVGAWLGEYPVPYAISHQVVGWPLYGFVFALFEPASLYTPLVLAYGVAVIGSSMTLEITRKLDPNADPVLKTYLVLYGPKATVLLTAIFAGVAAYGAFLLKIGPLLWPVEALMLLGASTVFWKPGAFKAAEGISALGSLLHLLCLAAAHFVGLDHLRFP